MCRSAELSRVGGLSKAKLLRDLAVELGLRVTIEDTWGGDLTTAAVAALAAAAAVALSVALYMRAGRGVGGPATA